MQVVLIIPTGRGVGLTSACLGLKRALEYVGLSARYYKPFLQEDSLDVGGALDSGASLANKDAPSPTPIKRALLERALSLGTLDELMEQVVASVSDIHADVLICEGLVATTEAAYATMVNHALSLALDAPVILVSQAMNAQKLADNLDIYAKEYGGLGAARTLGCIIMRDDGQNPHLIHDVKARAPDFGGEHFSVLGLVPYHAKISAPRTIDVANDLGARWLNTGNAATLRVQNTSLVARTLANVGEIFCRGMLLVTPADRDDVLIAAALAAMNGVPMAGVVLTGGLMPSAGALALCQGAFNTGLPVMLVDSDSYQTAKALAQRSNEIDAGDFERAELVADYVAGHLDLKWLKAYFAQNRTPKLSPSAFRYQLTRRAGMIKKRIILPEGDEPRTIEAVSICQARGIADCVLLAEPQKAHAIAKNLGVSLDGMQIINPNEVAHRYVEPMVARRQGKLTAPQAVEQLKDTVVLGTMMLYLDEVDGLVSGAIHTTANTVRPAFQLIKTAKQYSLVSSVFFMLLPEQVVVYGDCAINPNPTADELAEIAIQSAQSAKAFGIDPKIAMISYSTGQSGTGADVDKVAKAVAIAKARAPELIIDGPLQYDAASVASVGLQKAPNSLVAGQANVFIFPDLNTGNTTYKAVQRSAGVISVGPMLQGLNKPVNDLSRGALVDDIVYTIAITAIQAQGTV